MRFDDELDENGTGLPVVYMALGVSVFIFLILLLVITLNKDKHKSASDYLKYLDNQPSQASVTESAVDVNTENKRVASDLDIWDLYPEREETSDDFDEPTVAVSPSPTISPSVTPDYNDGKHISITLADGSEEWIAINDDWDKNNYDFTNLVNSGGILKYMADGRNISFAGIDVSRYQKEIDFARVKAQGIDFAMIRVGSRGYKNGELTSDEYFETNYSKASEAGLDVGVYFYSQAVTVQEAEEEAQFVINALEGKNVKYPVAFDMEYVGNDSSRVETLTKEEKTVIASAFVNKIKDAGFRPMIYGNKEWLLKRIDVSKFDKSSIWLAQKADYPDYPYLYDMWQYSTEGELYGIDGPVDFNICFVDYAAQ